MFIICRLDRTPEGDTRRYDYTSIPFNSLDRVQRALATMKRLAKPHQDYFYICI